MATVGNSATPGSGYFFDTGIGTGRGSAATMPSPGGYLTNLHAYFSAYNSSGSGFLCVWDASGNLLTSVAIGTVPTGTASIGGQAWRTAALGSSYYVAGGTPIYIGFSLPQASGAVWTFEASGTVGYGTSGNPGNIGAGFYGSTNALGAYADYTPLAVPTITGVAPGVGEVGTSVVITGTSFLHATGVTINGATVTSWTINSDTQITATVPSGATPGAGTIVVTNPAGSSSGFAFIVGQIFFGTGLASPVAIWYGDSGGAAHKVVGVWVPNGAGVKRVW